MKNLLVQTPEFNQRRMSAVASLPQLQTREQHNSTVNFLDKDKEFKDYMSLRTQVSRIVSKVKKEESEQ